MVKGLERSSRLDLSDNYCPELIGLLFGTFLGRPEREEVNRILEPVTRGFLRKEGPWGEMNGLLSPLPVSTLADREVRLFDRWGKWRLAEGTP